MDFFTNRRWINPSQPRFLQYATWLVYWRAFWGFVQALEMRALPSVGWSGLVWILVIATIPLAVFGGSDMAMGKRRGYYMCVAVAFIPATIRLVTSLALLTAPSSYASLGYGLGNAVRDVVFPVYASSMSTVIGFAFEVFLIFCLFQTDSRRYAKLWLDD